MFRKTPSNDRILSGALRKELENLPIKAKNRLVLLLKTYPRQCFAGMLISLMLSALLAFVIPINHRTEEANNPRQLMNEIKNLGSGMTDEVRSLFKIQDELKRMAKLKKTWKASWTRILSMPGIVFSWKMPFANSKIIII